MIKSKRLAIKGVTSLFQRAIIRKTKNIMYLIYSFFNRVHLVTFFLALFSIFGKWTVAYMPPHHDVYKDLIAIIRHGADHSDGGARRGSFGSKR